MRPARLRERIGDVGIHLQPEGLVEEEPEPAPPADLIVEQEELVVAGVAAEPAGLQLVSVLGAQRRRPSGARRPQPPDDSDYPHGPTPRYPGRSEKNARQNTAFGLIPR